MSGPGSWQDWPPARPIRVRGKDLADVLAPAYQRLAADDTVPGLLE